MASGSSRSLLLRFALGRLVSVTGAQMAFVAVSWELYERTHSPWSLGLVGLIELLPVLAFTLIAGNAADRFPRRHVGMAAQALLAVALAGLAIASQQRAPLVLVYALLFLVGTSRTFASPAINTIIPQLLPPAQFARANAWLASTYELAVITGPAIGGGLIVAAVHFVFIGFSNELGAFESGATAALLGPVGSVVAGGVGAVLVVLAVARLWPELARLGPLAGLTAEPHDA